MIKIIFPNPVKQGTITLLTEERETQAHMRLTDLLIAIKTLVAELGKKPNAFTLTQVPDDWQAHVREDKEVTCDIIGVVQLQSLTLQPLAVFPVDPRTPPQPAESVNPSVYM